MRLSVIDKAQLPGAERAAVTRYGSRLRQNVRWLMRICAVTGFDPRLCLRNLRGLPYFFRDAIAYTRGAPSSSFRVRLFDSFPILGDRFLAGGTADGAYFHQDLWAARRIFQRRPVEHIDVGSRVDGFVAHLLTFMPVTVIDIRPIQSKVPGLTFTQGDATSLKGIPSESIDSISSLHAAEHFGLGRYSDPVDPQACFQFMNSLERVLKRGGRLYFSVPVGRERVEFNAHRVFASSTIVNAFPHLTLLSYSLVCDDGALHEDVVPGAEIGVEYGCGLFEFTKSQEGPV
jgi:hypothetical protein